MVYLVYNNNIIRYEHLRIGLLRLHLYLKYVPDVPLLYVPVNALQPSDTDGCSGSRGSSATDSVSPISESSEQGSGSGPTLERRGPGLGTRARARMHVPGKKNG